MAVRTALSQAARWHHEYHFNLFETNTLVTEAFMTHRILCSTLSDQCTTVLPVNGIPGGRGIGPSSWSQAMLTVALSVSSTLKVRVDTRRLHESTP